LPKQDIQRLGKYVAATILLRIDFSCVIYRFNPGEEVNLTHAQNILDIIYDASCPYYTDQSVRTIGVEVAHSMPTTTVTGLLERIAKEQGKPKEHDTHTHLFNHKALNTCYTKKPTSAKSNIY